MLDIGCGKGATSVFLARESEVEVAAVDAWVSRVELQGVIDAAGVGDRVDAVNADARNLPFGDDEFDAVVSLDAFEYFGTDAHFLPGVLRVLRPGGRIGIGMPALATDAYAKPPPAPVTAVVGGDAAAWHAPEWWQRHWELSGLLTDVTARMQNGSRDDWILWVEASDDVNRGSMLSMLTSMAPDEIGFALVSGTKKATQPE